APGDRVRGQAVAVDVVAHTGVGTQLTPAVVGALPPASDERVRRAHVDAVVDRAAELRPAVRTEPAGAVGRPDDRGEGRPGAEEETKGRDDERRADGRRPHQESAPRR